MMYKLTDMRDANAFRLHYSEDKGELEAKAIDIMDSIKPLLPSKEWKIGTWGWVIDLNFIEYVDKNSVGTARVYVRINKVDWWEFCQQCGKPAQYETRSGYYCDDCIDVIEDEIDEIVLTRYSRNNEDGE